MLSVFISHKAQSEPLKIIAEYSIQKGDESSVKGRETCETEIRQKKFPTHT